MHECDRRETDRQTDNATEKSIGIGGVDCIAGAITPDLLDSVMTKALQTREVDLPPSSMLSGQKIRQKLKCNSVQCSVDALDII